MSSLYAKRILLGVCGGIAAYKSAELVRLLRRAGADVRVVMTTAAAEFVTARTFQALSGHRVWGDWSDDRSGMDHIDLARWADLLIIAPATADTLARLAHGRADELLCAISLASEAPQALAPAMNQAMWRNPATRDNVDLLQRRGMHLWGPAEGEQACGETGPGRMLEASDLCAAAEAMFSSGRLAGLNVMVTAGPTREPIDPVRFLSNRSSGKMGYAIARAAAEAGARVQLVTGPVHLEPPAGVETTRVESAQQMFEAVMKRVAGCDIFIAAAAVSDYRATSAAAHKIKKTAAGRKLELVPTPDILASVSALPERPFCVGFAAETGEVERHARKKRVQKGVELMAANRVGEGMGFDSDDNRLLLVWERGSRQLETAPKTRLARQLVEHIAALYRQAPGRTIDAETHAEHSA
jgi:phosphopantothenoylcysteine decarboxylase/phosphopantothenate--cysteine ligase